MTRLSIDVTPEQHQRLKAIAALHGQTLKDYILERTLPRLPQIESLSEEEALQRLEPRLFIPYTEHRRIAPQLADLKLIFRPGITRPNFPYCDNLNL